MSYLRFVSRVRPEVSTGCFEPLVYGSNILPSPDCEDLTVNGPFGNELGMLRQGGFPNGAPPIFYSDWSPAATTEYATFHNGIAPGQPLDRLLIQSDENPRSGKYHLRAGPGATAFGRTIVVPVMKPLCDPIVDSDMDNTAGLVYTARIAPGDTVELSCWIALELAGDVTDPGDDPTVTIKFFFFDVNQSMDTVGSPPASYSPAVPAPFGEGYVQYSWSAEAPAGSYYVQAWIEIDDDVSGIGAGAQADFDDFALSVTAG